MPRSYSCRGMSKETKDAKQNIRYLGFETTSDGGRRFEFAITTTGLSPTRVTLDIPADAFSGANRISYQESAKICYEKIRALLDGQAEISTSVQIELTRQDIARYRYIPRGRARPQV